MIAGVGCRKKSNFGIGSFSVLPVFIEKKKNMEQEFERILDKLATSTRSPRGRFSKANSWILLEKRLPHLQRRILSLHTMAGAAAVAVLCVLGW